MVRCCNSHPRVIFATSPPPESLLLARHLAAKTGLPYVCDIRDPWTHYFAAKYRSYADYRIELRLERNILNGAACVIANTESSRRQLIERVGVDPEKIEIISNGFDDEKFADGSSLPLMDNDCFNIVYTGLLSAYVPARSDLKRIFKRYLGLEYQPIRPDYNTRSPRWFLDGVRLLIQSRPDLEKVLRCHFAGAFDSRLNKQLRAFTFPQCIVNHGAISQIAANRLCAGSDLLLLLQVSMEEKGELHCTAVPGKLFNYLRTGIPILAPMEESDAARIIRELNAGVVVAPRDPDAIATALEQFIERWKRFGRYKSDSVSASVARYSRRFITGELARLLRNVAVQKSLTKV